MSFRSESPVVAAPIVIAAAAAVTGLAAPRATMAQAPVRGAFIVLLGTDTVAVEQYTRAGNRLEGDLITRSPRTSLTHYVVTLNADGTPKSMDVALRQPDGSPVTRGARSATVSYGRDTVTTMVMVDSMLTLRTAVSGAFPQLPYSFALYELWLGRARATRADTALAPLLGLGARTATPTGYRLATGDTVRVWYFGAPQYLLVDRQGLIQSVDATQTTGKIRALRVPAADVAIPMLAARFAAADAAGAGFGGVASPRDTTRATVGGATIWVDYGRPSLRGRDVWARGVLGDTLWRTGANAATQFGTDRDLVVNGTTIPAGTYTLFTHASPTGRYALIFNAQTGQWGTVYDASRDVARAPLTVQHEVMPVERFTIGITPDAANGGTLHLTWGDRSLALPFIVK